MIIVCALAALTTVLALVAHRRAWAAALGMVSGAAVVWQRWYWMCPPAQCCSAC